MGMYTALHFAAPLKRDVPGDVLAVLLYMLDASGQIPEPSPLPDHTLFRQTIRWRHMLVCDSYYFEADTHSTLVPYPSGDGWGLSVTCNFKNYASELDQFLDWVMPYVDAAPDDWLGYHMYEEDDRPTLIFYPGEMS